MSSWCCGLDSWSGVWSWCIWFILKSSARGPLQFRALRRASIPSRALRQPNFSGSQHDRKDVRKRRVTETWRLFGKRGLPSAQLPFALEADNQGFRRQHHQGTSWALKFRSQESKLKSIWETVLKRCFSLFGLWLNDPRLRGLGFPRSQARDVDAWYPLGVYPNTQKSGSQDRVQRRDHWQQFPLFRWDDDDKRETVSNTKVSQMTNVFKQNFVQKLWTQFQSCGLLRKMVMGYGLVVSFVPLPLPYDNQKMEPKRLVSHKTSIYLRAPLKTQDVSSFCALVPA